MPWPLGCIRRNEPLAKYTSIRIGGNAEWFAAPQSIEALREVLAAANAEHMPIAVLGGGTNTLVPDRGIRGLVIHLGEGFREVRSFPAQENKVRVRCGAALLSQQLLAHAARSGWGGLEWLAGLPGQIGGAVAMNAQNIGDHVSCVRLMDLEGGLIELDHEALQFSYRYSELPHGIILEVDLLLPQADPRAVSEEIRAKLERRNATQDLQYPSSGCAFRNPAGDSAGRLIDVSGLKGARIGDAQVSECHANFIVNVGQATAEDVLALIEFVRQEVYAEHGVMLEPEVRMIGEALHAIGYE